MSTIYLQVPYKEKELAKELGARWDNVKKQWYIPLGNDYKAFSRWMPADLQKWCK